MSFKSYKLGEVLELAYGKSLPARIREDGNIPVYGSGGIVGYHKEALVEGPGIIVGRKGTIGSVYYEKSDFFPIDTVYFVKNNSQIIDLKFSYYLLKNLPLASLNSDAAVPGLNRDRAYSLSVKVPELTEQNSILKVLQTYDDLIENNLRRIKLLEESALLLYQEWFIYLRFPGHEHSLIINGVPEGWRKLSVPNVIDINPKTVVPKDRNNKYVDMAALSENSMVITEVKEKIGNSGSKFKNGDTLFARITPCLENGKTGYVNFLSENETAIGSTEFIVLRPSSVPPEFVYCLARTYDFRENAIKSMIGSSGRQRVQVSCFDDYFVLKPSAVILDMFTKFISPIFEQIRILSIEMQKLEQARDLLLPKLMNGEI